MWADETQVSCFLSEHDFFFFPTLVAGGVLGSSQVQHGPLSHKVMTALLYPLSPLSSFAGNGITSGLALQTPIAGRGKVISTSSPQNFI